MSGAAARTGDLEKNNSRKLVENKEYGDYIKIIIRPCAIRKQL